jgi:heme oxygenase (mycobilin-producing)
MNVFITTGTLEFLDLMKKKYSNEKMILMLNNEHALLLHESNGPTVFQSSRKYEVIGSVGMLEHEGFMAFNNIPITEEGRPLFEHQMKNRLTLMGTAVGVKAIRILRPLKSETYIILTLWVNELQFQNWKNSKAYVEAPENNVFDSKSNIFSMPPYVTTYFINKEDKNK